MVRLLVFALLVWGLYLLIKKLTKAFFNSYIPGQHTHDSDSEAEMIRDPQCGAYFMKQKGVKAVIEGRGVYFCSKECRDRYLETRRTR